jgi:hypothetical protein
VGFDIMNPSLYGQEPHTMSTFGSMQSPANVKKNRMATIVNEEMIDEGCF